MLNLALFTCGVCGCSQEQNAGKQMSEQEEEIELLDPVGVAVSYDVAQVRNLYEAEVYSCVCAPAITEFAYNTDLPFEKYGKLPGESVASGNVLVYGDTISLDESYEQLAEEVEDKVEDYQDEINNLQEDLYDAEKANAFSYDGSSDEAVDYFEYNSTIRVSSIGRSMSSRVGTATILASMLSRFTSSHFGTGRPLLASTKFFKRPSERLASCTATT